MKLKIHFQKMNFSLSGNKLQRAMGKWKFLTNLQIR